MTIPFIDRLRQSILYRNWKGLCIKRFFFNTQERLQTLSFNRSHNIHTMCSYQSESFENTVSIGCLMSMVISSGKRITFYFIMS